jgi:GAF domain-containing protein
MLRDGRMIGALHVGNRHPTAFGETDAALLSALAAHAAVAIDNARREGRAVLARSRGDRAARPGELG